MDITSWITTHLESNSTILTLGPVDELEHLKDVYHIVSIGTRYTNSNLAFERLDVFDYWYNLKQLQPYVDQDWDLIIVADTHVPNSFSRDLFVLHIDQFQSDCPIIITNSKANNNMFIKLQNQLCNRSRNVADFDYNDYFVLLPRSFQLFCCVGVQNDFSYLKHFIDFYLPQVDSIHFLVHTSDVNDPMFAFAKQYISQYEKCSVTEWVGEFQDGEKLSKITELMKSKAVKHGWIIYSDVDELQQYPNGLRNFLTQCDTQGHSVVKGEWIEHCTQDGSLPMINYKSDLFEQFPKQFKINISFPKICAMRGILKPQCGGWHHLIHGQQHSVCFDHLNIHHFRWHLGSLHKYSQRESNFKTAYECGDIVKKHYKVSTMNVHEIIKGRLIDFNSDQITLL